MPASPAQVTVVVNPATPRGFLSGIPVILGHDSSYGTQNDPKVYFDAKSVSTDHGASTKTTAAAAAMFKNRAQRVVVVKPKRTAVVAENLGLVASGTLVKFPVTKTVVPVFTRDSVAKTVVYKYDSPLTGTPDTTEVFFNPYTGEYKWNATPVTSATADYSYLDFDGLKDALASKADTLGPYELIVVPNYPADGGSYGDYRKLAELALDEDWLVIAHLAASETVANGKLFVVAVDEPHLALVAHKDTASDVAALVAGVVSRVEPDAPIAYKQIRGLTTTYYLPDSEIGDVETTNTFEGEGINPIHRIGNKDVLTNERTAVDYADSGGEIYVSRVRLKINLKHRLRSKLAALLVDSPKIGFDQKGVAAVSSIITKELEDLVSRGAIRRDYAIVEPDIDTMSSALKKARKLGPFQVACTMIEGAHQINVEASLEVA